MHIPKDVRARRCITSYAYPPSGLFKECIANKASYFIEKLEVYQNCTLRIGVKDEATGAYLLAGTVCDFAMIEEDVICGGHNVYYVNVDDHCDVKYRVRLYLECDSDENDDGDEDLDTRLLKLKESAIVRVHCTGDPK